MRRINSCKKQEKGIKLIEPNENLSEEYFKNAEESLLVLKNVKETKSNMWLATIKYYVEYFAVYSILMRLGIKCEIHDCTISLMRFLEREGVVKQNISKSLGKDKELRIDNQYYLKNRPIDIDFEKLSEFMVLIRETLSDLDAEKIKAVRRDIENIK